LHDNTCFFTATEIRQLYNDTFCKDWNSYPCHFVDECSKKLHCVELSLTIGKPNVDLKEMDLTETIFLF